MHRNYLRNAKPNANAVDRAVKTAFNPGYFFTTLIFGKREQPT